jgi:hypothetical protein
LVIRHQYAAGTYTASVAVTDDDGGTATSNATVRIDYDTGDGILQPVSAHEAMRLFKSGSTVPIKIQVRQCDGSPAVSLHPAITIRMVSDTTPEGIEETGLFSTSAADTGLTMRHAGDGLYAYNLATKSLSDPTARYRVTVKVQPGQDITSSFGLRK